MNFYAKTGARLSVQILEAREVPAAFNILFDYRYDTLGFFNDPARRAELDRAADAYEARLNTTVDLASIAPSGSNSWTATTFNPSNTSQYVNVSNLSVGTDTIVVFVGAESSTGGAEAGLGGFGGYSASGSTDWLNTLKSRGVGGFSSWGGSISFDASENWNFSSAAPAANQLDFHTVVTHELGHVLGLGVATEWTNLVSGGTYTGANARYVNGGTNPFVSLSNPGHWQQGIKSQNVNAVSMQPMVSQGSRVEFSELDFAALADLGWQVTNIGGVSPPPVSPPVVPPAIPVSPIMSKADTPILVGGNGTFQQYTMVGDNLVASGPVITPFAGFTGTIRTASGDFNGDGIKDIVASAGPGGDPWVVEYDGATGTEIRRFLAFELGFKGGVIVATGNIQGNGKASLIVGADRGGGPRVKVYAEGNPAWTMTDFFAIADPAFSGGVRVAAGDVDGDGKDDLLVAAGFNGGPRVSLYSGASLFPTNPQERLIGDYFAFDSNVNSGAYVSMADFNGDGHADLVYGAGSGSGHVKILDGYKTIKTGQPWNSVLQDFTVDTPADYNGGVRVHAADLDKDGNPELLISSGTDEIGKVWLKKPSGLTTSIGLSSQKLSDGVFVG